MSNTRRATGPVPGDEPPGADDEQRRRLAEAAAELNQWTSFLSASYPTPIRFHVAVRDALVRVAPDSRQVRPQVRMIAVGVNGPHVMWLTPDLAEELGGLLVQHAADARAAASGLTVLRDSSKGALDG